MAFKLNCKPGEMAYVFRVSDKRYEFLLRRFVTVRELSFDEREFEPMWSIDEKIDSPILCPDCGQPHQVERIPDAWLRPIRGMPGQDETLQWKALPTETLETA